MAFSFTGVMQLRRIPVPQLARWQATLNTLSWPDDFLWPCPGGWETMEEEERSKVVQPIFDWLFALVPERDFSHAWWTVALGRTTEDWAAWWEARAGNPCC